MDLGTPSKETSVQAGRRVEDEALLFLTRESGFRLVARNYRKRFGELDIIGEEKRLGGKLELVFVEVRFRAADGWVDAVDSVTWGKRRKVERAARSFLLEYRGAASSVRFDILAFDGRSWQHLRGAW